MLFQLLLLPTSCKLYPGSCYTSSSPLSQKNVFPVALSLSLSHLIHTSKSSFSHAECWDLISKLWYQLKCKQESVRWRRRHRVLVDSHTTVIVWIRVESLLGYSHEWSVVSVRPPKLLDEHIGLYRPNIFWWIYHTFIHVWFFRNDMRMIWANILTIPYLYGEWKNCLCLILASKPEPYASFSSTSSQGFELQTIFSWTCSMFFSVLYSIWRMEFFEGLNHTFFILPYTYAFVVWLPYGKTMSPG